MTRAFRSGWILFVGALLIACGNDDADPADDETRGWEGPEITQESIDRFVEARIANAAGEDLKAKFGLEPHEFLAFNTAMNDCIELIRWKEEGRDEELAELEADVELLRAELDSSGLNATERQARQTGLDQKVAELDEWKAERDRLPNAVPAAALELVRKNRKVIEGN